MNTVDWQSELAVGACRAGRLLAMATLAFALLALWVLSFAHTSILGALLWSCVALSTVPGLYLGARIELDRGVFLRLIQIPENDQASVRALDVALDDLNLVSLDQTSRSLAKRVKGLFRLVRSLGGLVILQISLSLLAVWLR